MSGGLVSATVDGPSLVRVVRRWGLWVLIVGVVVAAVVVGARPTSTPDLAARSRALAEQVRCPVCNGESAEQSQVPAAVAIREQITAELAAGTPPAKVLSDLERSYGATILEKPPASGTGLLLYVLPVAVAVAALTGLSVAFARWRRRSGPLRAPVGGRLPEPATSPVSSPAVATGHTVGSPDAAASPDAALVARALAAAREGRT